jgi:hypothetical protein
MSFSSEICLHIPDSRRARTEAIDPNLFTGGHVAAEYRHAVVIR